MFLYRVKWITGKNRISLEIAQGIIVKFNERSLSDKVHYKTHTINLKTSNTFFWPKLGLFADLHVVCNKLLLINFSRVPWPPLFLLRCSASKLSGALASSHVSANTLSALKAPERQFFWLMKAINPQLFEFSHGNIFVGTTATVCSSHVREAVFGQSAVKFLLLFQFARKGRSFCWDPVIYFLLRFGNVFRATPICCRS